MVRRRVNIKDPDDGDDTCVRSPSTLGRSRSHRDRSQRSRARLPQSCVRRCSWSDFRRHPTEWPPQVRPSVVSTPRLRAFPAYQLWESTRKHRNNPARIRIRQKTEPSSRESTQQKKQRSGAAVERTGGTSNGNGGACDKQAIVNEPFHTHTARRHATEQHRP